MPHMLYSSLRRSTASILCALSLCAPAIAAFAQDATTEQELLELYVGDIFEILPVHTLENPTYTWILTQDRTFIEAGRAETFRKRLITPGRYTLYAEISSADQSKHLSRSFILDYKPRTPGMPITPGAGSGSTSSLVQTVPAQDVNKRVIVPEQSQLVKLEPLNPDVRPVVADMDMDRDTDGDGNPSNDIDTDLTFFQTDATPLYVWMAESFTKRTIAVTAAMPDGAMVQNIEVTTEAYAREQGLIQSPVAVEVKQTSGRTFNFTASFEIPAAPNTPLLYHWEFGDGQQSLLANPTHEYTEDGTYEVKLRIRNLTDGKDVAAFTQEVAVEEMTGGDTTPEPEQPVDTPDPEDTSTGSGVSIGSIMLMAGIFIASILFGLLVIFVLSKLRRKGTSMSDTIEAMEKSIIKKDDGSSTPTLSIAPAPAAVKTMTPPPEVAKREEEREMTTPSAATPKIDEANAPSWLKGGLNADAPKTTATPTPVATPKPTPAPVVPPMAAPQQKPAATPPWLQKPAAPAPTPAAPKPAAPAPATAPAVAPQVKPTPAPTPTPVAATPQVQPKPAAVPPWLQTPAAPAQPKPATPPITPAPAAPQVVTKPVTPPVALATPAPVAPKPVPAPQVPAAPKPVATPPVQQPVAPKPVTQPAPVPAPKPTTPTPTIAQTPAAPKPVTPPVATPTPAPKPVVAPATPAPVAAPKPVVPPASVAPVTPAPAAPIAPKPVVPPAPTPAPAATIEQNDEPIAIIRADSLGGSQPAQNRPDAPNPPAAA